MSDFKNLNDFLDAFEKYGVPDKVNVLEATSVLGTGAKMTTLELVFPTIILAETNTHRAISKSASSNRAIPTKVKLSRLKTEYYRPYVWGKNKEGMQCDTELSGWKLWQAKFFWWLGAQMVRFICWNLNRVGLHKQWANRWLVPVDFTKAVWSSTEWDNLLELRLEYSAQPEFISLAKKIKEALVAADSIRRVIDPTKKDNPFHWHLPYITKAERESWGLKDLLVFSVARCARTSYLMQEGSLPDVKRERRTFSKLIESKPMHVSPSEHQACGLTDKEAKSGNLQGYTQLRKMLEDGSFDELS